MIIATEVIYLMFASVTQTEQLSYNTLNTVIFSILGICTAVYLMALKVKKFAADENNQFLIERDALTSVYNRFSYEKELELIKKNKQPVLICAFDINELKPTNDILGHVAGDELIIGSANCIEAVFGKYGKVFRVGGDEFIAILTHSGKTVEELYAEFKLKQAEWKGKLVEKLSISCGIAVLVEDYDNRLMEALSEADKLMYADKRKHYSSKGIDRRKG